MSINVCNDRSMASITSLPSGVSGSSLVLISTTTASSDSTISITSGIDSTYKEYIFKFINMHPSDDRRKFQFQGTTDGSNFNVTMTTTWFQAYHKEDGSDTTLSYIAGEDQAQGTSFQSLCEDTGADNDQCFSGQLHLFDPSNTTFVKHFIAVGNETYFSDYCNNAYVAGYFNTTSAITGLQFKFDTNNIDSGTIKLYGVV